MRAGMSRPRKRRQRVGRYASAHVLMSPVAAVGREKIVLGEAGKRTALREAGKHTVCGASGGVRRVGGSGNSEVSGHWMRA